MMINLEQLMVGSFIVIIMVLGAIIFTNGLSHIVDIICFKKMVKLTIFEKINVVYSIIVGIVLFLITSYSLGGQFLNLK